MVLSIQVRIKEDANKRKRISVCWIPGHCGVVENEAGDIVLKEQMISND